MSMAAKTAEDWLRSGDVYLQEAQALWSRPNARELVLTCLVHAAERYLSAALAAKSLPVAPATELPELVAAVEDAGYDVLFFAGHVVELTTCFADSRLGFLPDDIGWDRLETLKKPVERLRDALFPKPHHAETYSGVLVCISGPSGVGKSTICRRLVERLDAHLSVSATTRTRRENEVDGRDYFFISKQDFEQRLDHDGFLEYAKVYGGNYYGTPAEPVIKELKAGQIVILEIEIEGTIQIVRRFPETVAIYILAPSMDDQARRLIGRQEDSEAAITERLSKADGEIRYAKDCGVYRYFVVNTVLDETIDRITAIIRSHAEKNRGRTNA